MLIILSALPWTDMLKWDRKQNSNCRKAFSSLVKPQVTKVSRIQLFSSEPPPLWVFFEDPSFGSHWFLLKWKLWEKQGAFILLFSTNYEPTTLSITMTSERFAHAQKDSYLLVREPSVTFAAAGWLPVESQRFFNARTQSNDPNRSLHWFLPLISTF